MEGLFRLGAVVGVAAALAIWSILIANHVGRLRRPVALMVWPLAWSATYVLSRLLAGKVIEPSIVAFVLSGLSLRASQLTTLIGLGGAIVIVARSRFDIKADGLVLWGLGFVVALNLSDLANGSLNVDPIALAWPLVLVAALALATTEAHQIKTSPTWELDRLLLMLIAPLAFVAAASVAVWLAGNEWALTKPRRIPAPFIDGKLAGVIGQHNGVGLIVSNAIVLAAALKRTWLKWTIFVVLGVVLLWTDSRTSLYGTVAALGVVVTFRRGFGPLRFVAATIGLLVTAGVALWLTGNAADLGDSSLNNRVDLWAESWQIFRESPLLGGGRGQFGAAFQERTGLVWASTAHSQWLQTLAQTGIVGSLLMAGYIGSIGAASFRLARWSGGVAPALFALSLLQMTTAAVVWIDGFDAKVISHFPHLMLVVIGLKALSIQRSEDDPMQAKPEVERVRVGRSS